MRMAFSTFNSLPMPMKFGSIAVGGMSLLGLIYYISPQYPEYIYIVFIGLIVVALLLFLYRALLKWMSKRKAAPLEQGIVNNAGSTPQGISDTDRLARIDDLRKKFSEGVQVFRASGKDLYSLPWYALVGEPGSGKTEAIRHCGVGFPPNLQDRLQGAGGTLNMNWWFTNHAVILDTAGRLMFEEMHTSATNEWEEFLKLLKTQRNNCPINGMLLVIPADSLIKDDSNKIQDKAGKIAQQLDHIQRILEVRFPVFVVISKSDLINGFREFFDTFNDPQQQNQILGWSNPGSLDEPFNPAEVTAHLEHVRQKLLRRRLGLLLDPVNSEDPSERRTDQVDALYAFPDSLMKINARLKLYLEMVFVAGEWSAKPLFLRGIYFTSAMREGSALDAELADALSVPVESLPEGRVWEREKSYFLKDLFEKKVFVEKGLVTRASNTKKLQMRRKGAIMGASVVSVALLLLFTWFGSNQLERGIGGQRKFWKAVDTELVNPSYARRIVAKDELVSDSSGLPVYDYRGKTILDFDDVNTSLGRFPSAAVAKIEEDIFIPIIFRPLLLFSRIVTDDYSTRRKDALGVVFESCYLNPLVESAMEKVKAEKLETWSPEATIALGQMIRLEAQSGMTLSSAGQDEDGGAPIGLDSLFRYVLHPSNAEGYKQYRENDHDPIQRAMAWLYSKDGGAQAWPPQSLGVDSPLSRAIIDKGVEHFIAYWAKPVQTQEIDGANKRLTQLVALRDALEAFKDAENLLLQVDDGFRSEIDEPDTLVEYDEVARDWARRLEELRKTKQGLDEAKKALGDDVDQEISVLCDRAGDDILRDALPAYEQLFKATQKQSSLLGQLESKAGEGEATGSEQAKGKLTGLLGDSHLTKVHDNLKKGKANLEAAVQEQISTLKSELIGLDSDFFSKLPPENEDRPYEVRVTMYELADQHLQDQSDVQRMAEFPGSIERLNQAFDEKKSRVGSLARLAPDAERFKNAAAVSRFVLRLGQRKHNHDLFDRVLASVPQTPEEFATLVQGLVEREGDKFKPWLRPIITGTHMEDSSVFDDKFHPEAAGTLFEIWDRIGVNLRPIDNQPAMVLERLKLADAYEDSQTGLQAYVEDYIDYWTITVRAEASVVRFPNWEKYMQKIRSIRAFRVNERLSALLDRIEEALGFVPKGLMTSQINQQMDKARLSVRLEKENLTPRFDDVCESTIRSWTGLPMDERKATDILLAQKPRDFERDYLRPYSDDRENPGVKYWNDLCHEGVRVLADAAQDRAVRAVTQLSVKYKAFPLCVTRQRKKVLSLDEVQAARQLLLDIGTVKQTKASNDPVLGIGQGGQVRYSRINDQLVKLTGKNVIVGPTEQWYEQLIAVSNTLRDIPPLNARLLYVPPKEQVKPGRGAPPVKIPYRFFDVWVDGQPLIDRLQTDQGWSVDLKKFNVLGKDLSFRFFDHSDDKDPAAVTTLKADWTVITAIHDLDAKPWETQELPKGDQKKWKIALTVKDSDEDRTYYYWLGFEFNRLIPLYNEWPDENNWPRE